MLGDVQYCFWFNPTLFRSWLKWSTHVPLDHIFNVKKKKKQQQKIVLPLEAKL